MISNEDIAKVLTAFKTASTYDFSDYCDRSFARRVDKILTDNKISADMFVRQLMSDRDFLEKSVRDITVNTTELFRDPQMWLNLRYQVLPRFKDKPTIKIWHAGCSSGQEIYSMMILLSELGMLDKAQIFATDINTSVIEAAQTGTYKYMFNLNYLDNFDKVMRENPYNFEQKYDVPYDKYFDIDKRKDVIQMKDFLCKKPVFRKHDLVGGCNPFYHQFDLILCRNVIIYFNPKLQNKVINMFASNLLVNGFLILGASESILGAANSSFERMVGFYRKKQITTMF